MIAGLQKLSLVDYPGCISSVIFLQGCNFNCPYCQNPDLISPEGSYSVSQEEVLDFLSKRSNMIEGVVITGGEPTLRKRLPELIHKIKDIGLKVKLDTNGAHPDVLEELLLNADIDCIAMDIKTALAKYKNFTKIEDIEEKIIKSIRLIMLFTGEYEFRTTCVPGIVGEEDMISIGMTIKGSKKYCLQQFGPAVTLDKEYGGIKPYTKKEIEKLRDILKDFVREIEIRGV